MTKYKKILKNIHQITIDNQKTKGGEIIWLNITNPGKDEIQHLRNSKKYNFALTHLQASSIKAVSQRPLVEKYGDYIFLILHFPILKGDAIIAEEVEFFIGKNYLVTLHKNIRIINDFFSICKKDGDRLLSTIHESSSLLLYEILEKLMNSTFALVDKYSIEIQKIEEVIFEQESKKAVSTILTLRRNIINTRKILQNHKNIIKTLMLPDTELIDHDETKKYFSRLLELSKRIWENFESQKEMIDVLNSTNESLLNFRISNIMKTLTIFSVIVFPLTLFAAIFGMNTMGGMPFVDNPHGFWLIIAMMFFGSLCMLLFFEKKKWM